MIPWCLVFVQAIMNVEVSKMKTVVVVSYFFAKKKASFVFLKNVSPSLVLR